MKMTFRSPTQFKYAVLKMLNFDIEVTLADETTRRGRNMGCLNPNADELYLFDGDGAPSAHIPFDYIVNVEVL